jgi:hypothetical protein
MKKLTLLVLICLPGIVNAQKLKYSRAYLAAILHDGKLGGSMILSYGLGKYLGIGAGVDLTSYSSSNSEDPKFFAPFYADLRFKYPIKGIEPFLFGQFGKPSFSQTIIHSTSTNPRALSAVGHYFYGTGIGISSHIEKRPNVFVSCTFRNYFFKYDPENYIRNGIPLKAYDVNLLVISAGLVF